MKWSVFLVALVLYPGFFIHLHAQPISSAGIDSLTQKVLTTFDVPGIAVAVVKDGKIIHAKGYGVRSLNTREKVDEHTLFGIASNSKAFTVAALAILVDEKKLNWNDKVTDFIPDFRMYNPYVTEDFTVRDLLTHRSGLGLGAGDLMFWPDSNNFTKKDIIHNLRYLKQVSGFRTKYDYDNLMYIVAGEVVAKVSGTTWENFVATRILRPLQMNETATNFKEVKNKTNVIDPHAPVEGAVKVIRRDWSEVANSAGGIYSNLLDMCKWISMQMNNGKYGEGNQKQLFSEAVHEEMWTPQTIIPVRGTNSYNTHFSSYGLGWFLSDVKGYLQATHTGGLAGIVTQVTLLPEMKLGIIVFTNQQSGAAFTSITNTIKDSYLGLKTTDWVKVNHERVLKNEAEAKKITDDIWKDINASQKNSAALTDTAAFTGTYHDKWFGDVVISVKNGKLWFDSKRSYFLTGQIFPYKGNNFIVKWVERSLDADAFLKFDLDNNGRASHIKMNAISPLTDFSFDFQDLDFIRMEKK
ncbi:MAG: beta-lactamase [Ferruginibacter sp.]|nr:beta-lactamase [Ferruginibacter sp.]